ncbi:serpin B3-like [Hippopotamus amphibius kiboko]|uniref:serpin B3-like n=1 Tax=Hippopotamus amphibius kiboko TaxID=575201 RepID=UPI002597D5E2|nr:serpin B3-like [Hippopotamus amphibius kiboko]
MSSLSEANTHFAVELFKQIRGSKEENIFYSPFNIMSALAMTSLGAKGHTASEIEKVLHFNEITGNTTGGTTRDAVQNSGNVHRQFQNLLTEIKKPSDAYQLKVANRLYGEKSIVFLQEYIDNVKKFYLASVESADFVHAAEESRKMINSWVESQTNEKIKDLFPKDSIDSSTVLVLVTAIYFKGQWHQKFKTENTVEEKFWLNKETSKSVQMMKQTDFLNFTSLVDMKVKILEIPYKCKELSMVVLLPDEVDGLQKLEDQLTAEKLIEWTSPQNMKEGLVDLHLPRFKVEASYSLNDPLRALGMVAAFSDQEADVSGMSSAGGLVVSNVIHKSYVEVNEEGTEAAAATGISIGITSLPHYESFHCDHPFLFFIKHNKTNTILFYGRVSAPEV